MNISEAVLAITTYRLGHWLSKKGSYKKKYKFEINKQNKNSEMEILETVCGLFKDLQGHGLIMLFHNI